MSKTTKHQATHDYLEGKDGVPVDSTVVWKSK